jgi:alkylation response protein AidB-like acyl-CoA dehydrogenase
MTAVGETWPPSSWTAVLTGIADRAPEHDRDGSFPFEAFDALHPTGALRLTIPADAGGLGGRLAVATAMVVAVGEADPSVALVLAQHTLFHALLGDMGWPAATLGAVRSSAIAEVALINALRVEPDLGTPARGGLPATVAERLPDDAGWRLTGRKIYSTGIPLLRWMLVYVRTDDPEPAAGNVLVEAGTPGYRVEQTWDSLGMRATRSDDVVFEGLVVPVDHALDLTTAPPPMATGPVVWNCLMMAAVYHGVARAARDWLARYLTERTPANLGQPLSSLPRFQEAMGRIDATVVVGDQLLETTAAAIDAGAPDAAPRAMVVKYNVTNGAIDAVLEAVRLTGNPGLLRHNPLERHLRNVLHGRIHTPQDDTILTTGGRAAFAAAAAVTPDL